MYELCMFEQSERHCRCRISNNFILVAYFLILESQVTSPTQYLRHAYQSARNSLDRVRGGMQEN